MSSLWSDFNLRSIYAIEGESISFDVDHPREPAGQIEYFGVEGTWGDPLDWVSINDEGLLSGIVPDGFVDGGGHINYKDSTYGDPGDELNSHFFNIRIPFAAEGSGTQSQIEIGDQWANSRMDYAVHVNSNISTTYNSEEVVGNAIRMSDGNVFTFSEFDQYRGKAGIEIAGSQYDDFIDLSGLTKDDFYADLEWYAYTDFEVGPGSDWWVAPSFKVEVPDATDNYFEEIFVGQLDAQDFYKPYFDEETISAPSFRDTHGLEIRFLGDYQEGYVTVSGGEQSIGTTHAENISFVGTSTITNDKVYGDDNTNIIMLNGGSDEVYGGGGIDYYLLSFEDDSLMHDVALMDYQRGEEITILGFPYFEGEVENLFNGALQFNRNEESGTSSISIVSEAYSNQIISLEGAWELNASSIYTDDDLFGAISFLLNPIYPPYDPSGIDLDSYQQTQLGSDKDIFFGEDENDYISTGGGDDLIYSGAGNDLIRVEGEGSVQVDTGEGSDHVSVSAGFSGTLLVKNGAGFNTLKIDQEYKGLGPSSDTDYEITLIDDSKIKIENQFELNSVTGQYEVSDTGFQYFESKGWSGLDDEFSGYNWRGLTGTNSDNLLEIHDHDDNNIVNILSGRGGDDELILAGGVNQIYGGEGDDTFKVMATDQRTSIAGDRGQTYDGTSSPYSGEFDGQNLPTMLTQNSSFADVVEIDWSYTDTVIENVAHGYRITNEALDAVVEVYDVEILKFANGDGTWDTRYLTEGAPVGKDNWMFGNAGKDIAYGDGGNISFVLGNGTAPEGAALSDNGTSDILQVYATVTQTETVTQWLHPTRDDKTSSTPRDGWREVTEEKVLGSEESLIWEGDRTAVDAFTFSDGVSINVINVADKGWDDAEIYSTVGTDGVDLIFGNDSDNLIDGKGGDDIIFGGDGDDVIIGGAGDDVLVGGAGDDIIRGDMIDDMDAAKAYFADLEDFDTDTLSIETSTVVEGNDVILGGDGIDDIESGEGKNLVASGRADMDGDGEADLDVIKEHMTTT